jgi:hypothetical protein
MKQNHGINHLLLLGKAIKSYLNVYFISINTPSLKYYRLLIDLLPFNNKVSTFEWVHLVAMLPIKINRTTSRSFFSLRIQESLSREEIAHIL